MLNSQPEFDGGNARAEMILHGSAPVIELARASTATGWQENSDAPSTKGAVRVVVGTAAGGNSVTVVPRLPPKRACT